MDNLQTIDSYNKIILDNEWLIYKIINKYTSHLELEDLYQVASIGLIKAYKSFKDDYNTKFSSYAYKYVLGEVIKYVNQYRSIKVNKEMGNLYGKILKVRDLFCQKHMREPSNYELSVFMGIDEITLTEIMKANMEIDSLDKIISIDDKEMYLYDIIGYDAIKLDQMDLYNEISKLSEEEQKMIKAKYYYGLSQQDIGNFFGMHQVEVSRKLTKTIGKLRDKIAS